MPAAHANEPQLPSIRSSFRRIGRRRENVKLQNEPNPKSVHFRTSCTRTAIIAGLCCSALALAQNPDAPARQTASSPAPSAGVYRFRTVSIMDDPRHIGGEAYRILAPADWRVEGGITWKNAASDPAAPWVKLMGPAKQEIGVLPPIAFIWNPRMFGQFFRPGSFYSGTEVQPPLLDPVQCIKTIIIPRYRRNLLSANVVRQEPLPELAAAGREKYPQPEYRNAVFQAGKMRFEYLENGVEMEEDVYVLTAAVQFPVGPTVSTMWAPDEIRYSKAPKGMLDAQVPLFQTALFSLRPNLKWWAALQQVSQELARLQMQASNAAVSQAMQRQMAAADRTLELSQHIAKNNGQISDSIMKGYQNRQATMDRVNARWDRTIRGVEVYRNAGTGDNVELPSGYNSAWRNQSGEYLVTGSVNYDPNSASNGSWTRLEKINP
ncbi:MAG TPA: hypothetical protein VEU11_02765 [Terriglobales bacterium]|nr:hypothetical protein [Terriglobales bacterium]